MQVRRYFTPFINDHIHRHRAWEHIAVKLTVREEYRWDGNLNITKKWFKVVFIFLSSNRVVAYITTSSTFFASPCLSESEVYKYGDISHSSFPLLGPNTQSISISPPTSLPSTILSTSTYQDQLLQSSSNLWKSSQWGFPLPSWYLE